MKNKKKLKHVLEAIAENLYLYCEDPAHIECALGNYFWSIPSKYWEEFHKKVSKKVIRKQEKQYADIREAMKKSKKNLKSIKSLLSNDNDNLDD